MHRPECTFYLMDVKKHSRSDLGYDLILSARTSIGRGDEVVLGVEGVEGVLKQPNVLAY